MANDALFVLAQSLLGSVEAIFIAAGVTLPSPRYVADGDIARDCNQVVVSCSQMYLGQSGGQVITPITKGAAVVTTAEFLVEIIRCAPNIPENSTAPSAGAIETSAKIILTDGKVLFDGVRTQGIAGTLLEHCDNFAIGAMQPIGPEGGIVGWQLKIAVQFNG